MKNTALVYRIYGGPLFQLVNTKCSPGVGTSKDKAGTLTQIDNRSEDTIYYFSFKLIAEEHHEEKRFGRAEIRRNREER